jgi:hypothetical protein
MQTDLSKTGYDSPCFWYEMFGLKRGIQPQFLSPSMPSLGFPEYKNPRKPTSQNGQKITTTEQQSL